jgi:hypothetical protein
MKNIIFIIFVASWFLLGCKDRYESPVVSPTTGYLVVEGVINSGQGPTTIILSRTARLSDKKIVYEGKAQVKVEGNDRSSFSLKESETLGEYTIPRLSLNPNSKYRLSIKTSDGKEYLSDFVAITQNPPIDSISWKPENRGAQLYVSTHNPKNNTRYYQWEFSETWEYHSTFRSFLKYRYGRTTLGLTTVSVVYRDTVRRSFDSTLYYCWKTQKSSNLTIGSSVRLSQDIIYQPLTFIPPNSEKLGVLYSILLRQYSLSKENYEFLERLKKNTELTGSIFDAQPSELNGNIKCVSNPSEPVIGYVGVCEIQEKRLFLDKFQTKWDFIWPNCREIEYYNSSDSLLLKGAVALTPTRLKIDTPYLYAAGPVCVECVLRGGTNKKPPFWPN